MLVKICLLLIQACLVISDDEAAGAVEYSAAEFESEVAERPHFVKFYAPWCGHCKRLAPTWDELAEALDPKSIVVAKVDCTKETALCSSQGVGGYPTLRFFNGDTTAGVAFKGARDLESLKTWAMEQIGIEQPKPEAKDAEKEGHVFVLTQDSYEKHVSNGNHFIKFYAPWCPHCKNMVGAWDQLAEVYNVDDSAALISKVDCTAHREVCTSNAVKGYPTLLWIRNGEVVEKYSGGRDVQSFKSYVEKMKNTEKDVGTTEEKIPDLSQEAVKDVEEDVLVLDSENFADTIATGVTFVEFYAPWCGHCKRLAPTWIELGKKFQDSKNVKIAKVDCTQQRDLCGKHSVRGFPTLILFRNGENLADYNGKRDLEALSTFLADKVPHDEL